MSSIAEIKTTIPSQLLEEFGTLLKKTFASEPQWLKEKRSTAFEKFSKLGIPERKNEEYKYTDVKKIFGKKFTPVHNDIHKIPFKISEKFIDKDSIKLFFVNGWLYKDSTLSTTLPKGVIVGSMAADALFLHRELFQKFLGTSPSQSWTEALNSALWFDGAFIYIPKGIKLEKNIEIVHLYIGNDEILVNPRHLIIADKESEVNIIEHSFALDVQKHIVVNSVAEIAIEESAKVSYYKIQSENKNTFQLNNTYVTQQQQSVFNTCTFTLGSEWIRNNLSISLNAENCETHLNGLFITQDAEHVDNHTQVYHNKPNCQSNQLYKGILNDKSTGVFNGKIYVARDAQKTNAYQSSKNILLSDDATINTKPQLEIYADDVKCSHGSSTGQIDEDALFYLRSRGLNIDSAKNLLMYAFASDVVNTIKIETLRSYINELVQKYLNK